MKKDDIDKILQIIQADLEDEYGIDEGAIGRTLGGIAGVALAGGPEDPLSIPAYKVGSEIGDKLGDKVSNFFSKKKDDAEVDETVGGGSWLEEADRDQLVHQLTQVQNQIEKIVRTGGRVGLNDPLSQKMKMLKDKIHSTKAVKESTALAGQYGHSGRLEEFKGNDPDTIARIQALAGVRSSEMPMAEEAESSVQATDDSQESGLLRMKSLAGIFIR